MVRLRPYLRYKYTGRLELFQFHYGTIKTIGNFKTIDQRFMFQFHYGTIKTPMPQGKFKGQPSFNSTMVRLRPVSGYAKFARLLLFQFH